MTNNNAIEIESQHLIGLLFPLTIIHHPFIVVNLISFTFVLGECIKTITKNTSNEIITALYACMYMYACLHVFKSKVGCC